MAVWLLPIVATVLCWATSELQPDAGRGFRALSQLVATGRLGARHPGAGTAAQVIDVVAVAVLLAVLLAGTVPVARTERTDGGSGRAGGAPDVSRGA